MFEKFSRFPEKEERWSLGKLLGVGLHNGMFSAAFGCQSLSALVAIKAARIEKITGVNRGRQNF